MVRRAENPRDAPTTSKTGRRMSCGNAPWKSRQKPARFPHSHSSGDEGGWKSGKPKAGFPLSHRLDSSLYQRTKPLGGRASPSAPAALRSASVVSFYSAVVGNFLSALDTC